MSDKPQYTPSQKRVIDSRSKRLLVSASAGTGKTTVMIERIVSLLEKGELDISELVVVTFTNLAAAEMKNRLSAKLAEKRGNKRLIDQLERLDGANISTLHAFCSELLRTYFYVVDIDPAFAILDTNVVANVRKNALNDVFTQYYAKNDDVFKKIYKIFSESRQEEKFKNVILSLYSFASCIEDFPAWYAEKRKNFSEYSDGNPVIVTLLNDIKQSVGYYIENMRNLAERSRDEGLSFADVFLSNAEILGKIRLDNLENAINDLCRTSLNQLPRRSAGRDFGADKDFEEKIRRDYVELAFDKFRKKYETLCRGESLQVLWGETQQTLAYLDKLVEVTIAFSDRFYALKKERGGVDFNDLEHLTLSLLNDAETLAAIQSRYKMIFVDEYQDTNPVQEAIISKLSQKGSLFMVGDVKQSIYGFRGCEPQIFADKYQSFKTAGGGQVEELNDNFRSNREILDFVNEVFCAVMMEDFGKVNYRRDAQLRGSLLPVLKTASARVDVIVAENRENKEAEGVYDIERDEYADEGVKQGKLIADRIKKYVGMPYTDKDGAVKHISYGDIVILMRSLKSTAADIYNALIAENVPVVANFRSDGYSSKEIKDLINLFRVLDNPYNDVYVAGVCLSPFGQFTEDELGIIRLDTEGRIPFCERLQTYAKNGKNPSIVAKIDSLMQLLAQLRFFSHGATVSEVAIKAIQTADYLRYVQGLPNGGMRMRSLYGFIDGVKDASYAVSITRFLSYLDESEEAPEESGSGQTNAVRLMTMHASKGLEFPVVFVAGLETQFVDRPKTLQSNFDLGLAINCYDFSSMRYAKSLGYVACSMVNRTKELEESMRLLYVAMTRAKYVLNLVGVAKENELTALPKMPSKAASCMDWILNVLKSKFQTVRDVTASQLQVCVAREYESEDITDGETNCLCEQNLDERAILEKLQYVYPYASQTDMPSKVVSSQLDKEYIDVTDSAEHVISDNADRNFIGTAYHKVYQYVDYNADRQQILQTIEELVCENKIERKFADMLDVNLIYSTLNNPELRQIMSQGKVYHEIPFMLLAPYNEISRDQRFTDETMLQGVIDLLVAGKNKAAVIDFKYTARSDLAEKRYKAQLASYKLAVTKICGITDVSCYVLSVADNKLIKMQ